MMDGYTEARLVDTASEADVSRPVSFQGFESVDYLQLKMGQTLNRIKC